VKILFDHCVPKPLMRHLPEHDIKTAYQRGWEALKNGKLLDAAQVEFDVLLTVDQNLMHQQNVAGRSIALIVLIARDNRVATLLPLVPNLLVLLPTVEHGNVYEVQTATPSA
jgi:predicted nuclease of predicted toxin-antitoxin system